MVRSIKSKIKGQFVYYSSSSKNQEDGVIVGEWIFCISIPKTLLLLNRQGYFLMDDCGDDSVYFISRSMTESIAKNMYLTASQFNNRPNDYGKLVRIY